MTEQVQERRKPDTVVTSENLAEFQRHKLDIAETVMPPKEEKPKVEEKVEAKVEPKVEAKEEKIEEELDKDTKKVIKKTSSKLEERFSELTRQRKEAQARAEAAEKETAELKAKLTPKEPVSDEPAKPDKSKYTDAFLYAEDLAAWSAQKALRDKEISDRKTAQDAERQRVIDAWSRRLEVEKGKNPDFMEKVLSSTVQVSEEVKEAIIESEIGPSILLHLAENPEEAEKINKMKVGTALVYLGKLEAKLSLPKEVKKEEVKEPEVEISRAPAPISPLKGASASADLPIDSNGVWTGTFEQYKEARRAGKIK